MSKRVFRIAALALALMMIGGAALSEVVTTGSVWLRSAPNLNAEQITSYKEGKSLTFLGETAEDAFRIEGDCIDVNEVLETCFILGMETNICSTTDWRMSLSSSENISAALVL